MKFDRKAILFLTIIAVAIFLRTYRHGEWLYFKMDQARDAFIISNAVKNGPEHLPLLGPRAGATKVEDGYLRLGPAYYYFQYLSGAIFNSTDPEVFAYPDLFFSILAIILLYFFARIYFSKAQSLLIAATYSFSFLIVEYSRFAWNPNALQFFILLTFFGLTKFLNEDDKKKKFGWLAVWIFGLSIGSQLHFFGFFALLGISGLLIAFHHQFWKIKSLFKKNALKNFALYSVAAIFFFVATYAPVIISDVMKDGQNAKNFISALSSKPDNKPLTAKIAKNISENAKYYCLITTSFCNEGKAKESPLPVAITAAIIFFGLALAIRRLRSESSLIRKDFLALIMIWVGVFFILTIPVSFQLRPRFFILVFAIPFLLLGLIFDFFNEKFSSKARYLIAVIFVGIILSNAFGIYAWFGEQRDSQMKDVEINRTLILKVKDGVTLGQLQGVANYIYAHWRKYAQVYFYVKAEHAVPIKYLLEEKNDPNLNYSLMKSKIDSGGQFFAVLPSHTGLAPLSDKYGDIFTEISSQQFGQIKVYEIRLTNLNIDSDFKSSEKDEKTDRVFWKDVFDIKNDDKDAVEIDKYE